MKPYENSCIWIAAIKCSENWTRAKEDGCQERMISSIELRQSEGRSFLPNKWLTVGTKPVTLLEMAKLISALGSLSGKRDGVKLQTVQSYYFCKKFRVEDKLAASSLIPANVGHLKRKPKLSSPKSLSYGPLSVGETSLALSQASRVKYINDKMTKRDNELMEPGYKM